MLKRRADVLEGEKVSDIMLKGMEGEKVSDIMSEGLEGEKVSDIMSEGMEGQKSIIASNGCNTTVTLDPSDMMSLTFSALFNTMTNSIVPIQHYDEFHRTPPRAF